MEKVLIKNGRVIDPLSGFDGLADIILKGDRIEKIVKGKQEQKEYEREEDFYHEVIDASGLMIAPGLIDVHVHFRDPGFTYKEDIKSGAEAAKAGGFTTVVCMANTKPPIDTVEALEYVLEAGKSTGIHVLAAATISKGLKGEELTNMKELKEHGAAGFTDDGIPIMNETLAKKAMEEAKKLNLPLSFHEETPAFIFNNGINRGGVSEKLGIGGSPAVAEDSLVARDCMIALHTKASVNIQHISSKNSVHMIALAKKLGADVWAEVTPHHFSLNENAVLKYGTLAKMNPPLRTEEDRQALIEGLRDGTIDLIATDHAPHSKEEKEKSMTEAPSGIIGLETALSLAITNLVRPGYLSYIELFKKMCTNPAKLYRLDAGTLTEGKKADLVIFDETEYEVKEFKSKSSNSPFIGQRLTGKVRYTICEGKVVYKDPAS